MIYHLPQIWSVYSFLNFFGFKNILQKAGIAILRLRSSHLLRMKKIFLTFMFCFLCLNFFGQNQYLKVYGENNLALKTIDSVGYSQKHANAKAVADETTILSKKLVNIGFIETQIEESGKLNDSTFFYKFTLGKQTKFIHIYIGEKFSELLDFTTDTLKIPLPESEAFLNQIINKIEVKGFSMAKVKLIDIKNSNGFLTANLYIYLGEKRNVNDIVINGYEKFPAGHKKNIKRLYRNKVFNQQSLDKLYKNFEQFRFVKQTKYPEILFTKDSTKIYVYLEKSKSNTFDGFIGFNNDETNKVVFTGYVDLSLQNVLNSGEKIAFFWKSDGQDQKTFNLGVELPYIFKSPLGLKGQLNIFKQDSTFQTTQTNIDLGYFFNYNSRLYLGYQSAESSDIQNLNSATLNDFTNTFLTSTYEFVQFKNDDFLFPEKTNFNLKIGTGNRDAKLQSNSQFFGKLNLKYNFYLNQKNIFNIKSQNFYLQSDSYIINELQRFGGINSIRGFNENSLQANTFTSILTEYRYVLSPSIYVHSIIDYAYIQDKTSNLQDNLLGLGFGFGLLTKNGLFNIIYANGSTNDQAIKLSNSIVHISLKATF